MSHPIAAFLLHGRSDFDSLAGFSGALAASFHELKIEPFIVNLTDWQQSLNVINDVLQKYGQKRIIGAFSFSGVGIELGEGTPEGNVWNNLKIPMVTWIMDHPSYILKRSVLNNSALVRLHPTKDFVEFQRDYIKAPGRNIHCRMGTFTHGIEPSRRVVDKSAKPLIVFAKSIGNEQDLRYRWTHLPKQLTSLIEDAIEHYWGETERWNSVVPSVLSASRAHNIELQNDLSLFCFLITQVDQYIRMRKANILINDLLKLPVTIYGRNVEHIDGQNIKATLLPPIPYLELMDEYRKALAVISMNPNSEDDCHDRNYNAFGTGALPISDISPWWKTNFPELMPYSYDFRDISVATPIDAILNNPTSAAEIAWQVGCRMRTERPMKKVAEEAVNWALAQRYFEFDFVSPIDGYVR